LYKAVEEEEQVEEEPGEQEDMSNLEEEETNEVDDEEYDERSQEIYGFEINLKEGKRMKKNFCFTQC